MHTLTHRCSRLRSTGCFRCLRAVSVFLLCATVGIAEYLCSRRTSTRASVCAQTSYCGEYNVTLFAKMHAGHCAIHCHIHTLRLRSAGFDYVSAHEFAGGTQRATKTALRRKIAEYIVRVSAKAAQGSSRRRRNSCGFGEVQLSRYSRTLPPVLPPMDIDSSPRQRVPDPCASVALFAIRSSSPESRS